ncbi:DJ-1/PfpI family protein [Yinghuangia soli]|uniref:DJ-1/PfpI family protein n=1 Tax=Yinghuangia soli TaxID=2908204 RepID=A0AA41Q5E9_9ACTN|nr:DJ-1/PfpI family protein [Yinghuangia soli]MCF2531904.1 DJ-1/PfpI family protein [Yinghuangia soli]
MTETDATPRKTIAFVAYPGLTLLDIAGPLQTLAALPRFNLPFEVVTVAAQKDTPMGTDTPLGITANRSFAEVPAPDVLIVPGGEEPTLAALADKELVDYIRTAGATAQVIASVCTGALLLGEAGLLDGRRATTHWIYRERLPVFGATPVAERWVEDGPVITAAGVAAGIDMALKLVERLVSTEFSRLTQLFIEYDPQPPQGPLDWDAIDIPSYDPIADGQIRTALEGHPELMAKLLDAKQA